MEIMNKTKVFKLNLHPFNYLLVSNKSNFLELDKN